MTVTIYHNPKCSKSRQTLQLLEEQGVETKVVEYLKTPPTTSQLEGILSALSFEPQDLMRKGEDLYKGLKLRNSKLSREQLISTMIENPKLIERPIVVTDKGVRIGRPPLSVLEIL